MQSPGQVTSQLVFHLEETKRYKPEAKQFKMELLNIFALLVYIQIVQGFFNPYQIPYLKAVPVLWPYNHYYYTAYPQQPKYFQVSLFFVTPSIICKIVNHNLRVARWFRWNLFKNYKKTAILEH